MPATFPHYTQHTVEHRDGIVLELSALLLDEQQGPTIDVSDVELYVLIAAAYLHDIGMVVSEDQKCEAMSSDDWRMFISRGDAGHDRWESIVQLRASEEPDYAQAHSLADVQLRFLLAEFLRRTHHLRARGLLTANPIAFGDVAMGDPVLLETIAAVCAGHGLTPLDLEDSTAYPDRRTALGQPVNVRFLSILLRIGDLLEMSIDRACPLLLSAASPLPPESYAHWTQYQRITHRLVAPDRIELIAQCEDQNEHRYLLDWCTWLVEELRHASWLMSRASRHSEWRPPAAEIEGPNQTIQIEPAPGARYVPVDWRLELDHDTIVDRLVNDAQPEPVGFLRELVQNAADASRCRAYEEVRAAGGTPPSSPTLLPQDLLERYPIRVIIDEVSTFNPMAQATEPRQRIRVVDRGIGMTSEIISSYLLQIGRSFYQSEEFRRRYSFCPVSKFGIGFLSVFSSSDTVVIETRPFQGDSSGLQLTLTGPKSHLLVEECDRDDAGTCITVILREPMDETDILSQLQGWCRRLEFPLIAECAGQETTIVAERGRDFVAEVPDVLTPGASLIVRAFPADLESLQGELFVFVYRTAEGAENWTRWNWARFRYATRSPSATVPDLPPDSICVHGLAVHTYPYHQHGQAARVDVRGNVPGISLGREGGHHFRTEIEHLLRPRWLELLNAHLQETPLALGDAGWSYKQRLMDEFPYGSFWLGMSQTVRYWEREDRLSSINHMVEQPVIVTATSGTRILSPRHVSEAPDHAAKPNWVLDVPSIGPDELAKLSEMARREFFVNREVTGLHWLTSEHIAAEWSSRARVIWEKGQTQQPVMDLLEMSDESLVGFPLHRAEGSTYDRYLLNERNSFVRWLIRAVQAAERGDFGLTPAHSEHLYRLLQDPVGFRGLHLPRLLEYVEAWNDFPELPEDLRSSTDGLTADSFVPAGLFDALQRSEETQ